MAYVASNPRAYLNTSIGSGQCVALVQAATGAPLTRFWTPGPPVKGSTDLAVGTAIASFDPDGRYGNHTDHRSHAAIYMGQNEHGIEVIDQWVKRGGSHQMAHSRIIPWANQVAVGHPANSDNGNMFNVVE